MKLNLGDLWLVRGHASRYLLELPERAQLLGHRSPLHEDDRKILAMIHGVINLLSNKGLLRADLKFGDLDLPFEVTDSSVDDEGSEAPSEKAKTRKNHGNVGAVGTP